MTDEQKLQLAINNLSAIASLGGNQPDANLTTRSGPNDAAHRGILYCNARTLAINTLKGLGAELPDMVKLIPQAEPSR